MATTQTPTPKFRTTRHDDVQIEIAFTIGIRDFYTYKGGEHAPVGTEVFGTGKVDCDGDYVEGSLELWDADGRPLEVDREIEDSVRGEFRSIDDDGNIVN